jgi:ParB family transcriptional regulator, chromosome partitioning protein
MGPDREAVTPRVRVRARRYTAAMATRKRPVTKSGTPRKRKGVKLTPTSLGPTELALADPPAEAVELAGAVAADGGAVLATYREPLGGHVLLLAALPVEKVERTPFQRDVSDGHVRRLTVAMDKTRRYLDPIIATREADGRYLTPNGGHRLTALKELGARAVLALLVPEREVAYQILALNIEKAHNLREKALEVARMYRDLAGSLDPKESEMELQFEEAALVTLGFAYEERPRLSGSAYAPILRKVDAFLAQACSKAVEERQRRARLVLGLDDAVAGAVARLKEKGFDSPYLKAFVVGRINPLRFIKGERPGLDELMATMTKRAAGLDPGKVKSDDVARSGGPPDAE